MYEVYEVKVTATGDTQTMYGRAWARNWCIQWSKKLGEVTMTDTETGEVEVFYGGFKRKDV